MDQYSILRVYSRKIISGLQKSTSKSKGEVAVASRHFLEYERVPQFPGEQKHGRERKLSQNGTSSNERSSHGSQPSWFTERRTASAPSVPLHPQPVYAYQGRRIYGSHAANEYHTPYRGQNTHKGARGSHVARRDHATREVHIELQSDEQKSRMMEPLNKIRSRAQADQDPWNRPTRQWRALAGSHSDKKRKPRQSLIQGEMQPSHENHPIPRMPGKHATSRNLGTNDQKSDRTEDNTNSDDTDSMSQAASFVSCPPIPTPELPHLGESRSRIQNSVKDIDDVRDSPAESAGSSNRYSNTHSDKKYSNSKSTTGMKRPQSRRLSSGEYTVGLICPLDFEVSAVRRALDEEYDGVTPNGNDPNIYTFGKMAGHNVVVACLPAGRVEISSAATVATALSMRFRSIRVGLLVGIGGGVPGPDHDIRLGDVVVSGPRNQHGGVIQYDFGKFMKGKLVQIGSLQPPPQVLLNAVTKLKSSHMLGQNNLGKYLSTICGDQFFAKHKAGNDNLFIDQRFQPDSDSVLLSSVRRHRKTDLPFIHYGTIASGNKVIKDGNERDEISETLGGVLCFEMEAAGVMNNFPCLVVREISDYADSYKNDDWQRYAAAAAAAYVKELLSVIPSAEVAATMTVFDATSDLSVT
ncbi:MAG: hypothetical protein M1822_002068 [Bathelium mastoideum]|nr:MAG: hypothetical protein M1822_002068 [Bathelium mastoideum]